MPYLEEKYVTLCDSCNKPITGESVIVNATKGHQKIWIYHSTPIDCAYSGEAELDSSGKGGDYWIGMKSRLR